jgi:hypothetical protein
MALADFTAEELNNLTNSVLDFYMKGDAMAQSLQERPFLQRLKQTQSMFPGGKEFIRGNVKGDYTTEFQGYSYDDPVEYRNPANIRQFTWPWFELHAGISLTHTELKHGGITVTENGASQSTSTKSQAAIMQITDILKDKLDDMMEGSARSMNLIAMRDGSQSAKVFPGLRAIVRDNPATGIVGGIDAGANPWWRNRARTAASGGVIASSPSAQTLTKTLRFEMRQLRRYGGRPNFAFAGSGFIEKLEAEVHEKGLYTQSGFTSGGATNISMPSITIPEVGQIVYDPTLDDEGLTNRCYVLDMRHLMLKCMDGEDMKTHAPARPENRYVMYRAVTWTGTMMARKLNCHGVYDAS